MIIKLEAFKIVCDGCGCDFPEAGESAVVFPSIADARSDFPDYAVDDEDCDWKVIGDKHWCPDCQKKEVPK